MDPRRGGTSRGASLRARRPGRGRVRTRRRPPRCRAAVTGPRPGRGIPRRTRAGTTAPTRRGEPGGAAEAWISRSPARPRGAPPRPEPGRRRAPGQGPGSLSGHGVRSPMSPRGSNGVHGRRRPADGTLDVPRRRSPTRPAHCATAVVTRAGEEGPGASHASDASHRDRHHRGVSAASAPFSLDHRLRSAAGSVRSDPLATSCVSRAIGVLTTRRTPWEVVRIGGEDAGWDQPDGHLVAPVEDLAEPDRGLPDARVPPRPLTGAMPGSTSTSRPRDARADYLVSTVGSCSTGRAFRFRRSGGPARRRRFRGSTHIPTAVVEKITQLQEPGIHR